MNTPNMPYVYAKRRPGRCDDCGNGPVRVVRFWLTGMFYTVCQRHESEYRYSRALLRGSWRDRAHHDAWLAAANAAAAARAAAYRPSA